MASYSVSFEKVHFRTALLRYQDQQGESEVHLEQSAVPEYDWIGAEPDLHIGSERLQIVLARIQEWAQTNGLRIKFLPKGQLGI